MLGFFKKKEPDSLTSKSSYYERECIINNTTDLFLMLSDFKHASFEHTDDIVTVNNITINGISIKSLTKILDTPKYTFINDDNISGHKVLFYKEEADIYRFLLQFHFIDEKLFFVANKIYTGMSLPDSNKVKIVKQLAQKYLNIADFEVPDEYGIFISDKKGNKAFTRDGVYFYVNYLTGDSITDELWQKYSFMEEELAKKKADTFKESLDKLL